MDLWRLWILTIFTGNNFGENVIISILLVYLKKPSSFRRLFVHIRRTVVLTIFISVLEKSPRLPTTEPVVQKAIGKVSPICT